MKYILPVLLFILLVAALPHGIYQNLAMAGVVIILGLVLWDIFRPTKRVKHYLVLTLIYGGGEFLVFLSFLSSDAWWLSLILLFLLIPILFFVTEIIPRKSPTAQVTPLQRWNKVLLFTLLSSFGAGLASIWLTIYYFSLQDQTGGGGALFVALTAPIACICSVIALGSLIQIIIHRSEIFSQKVNDTIIQNVE